MKEKKTNISMELLLLNDLLRTNVIDKSIYHKASQEILDADKKTIQHDS